MWLDTCRKESTILMLFFNYSDRRMTARFNMWFALSWNRWNVNINKTKLFLKALSMFSSTVTCIINSDECFHGRNVKDLKLLVYIYISLSHRAIEGFYKLKYLLTILSNIHHIFCTICTGIYSSRSITIFAVRFTVPDAYRDTAV